MKQIPLTDSALMIRTDFKNEAAWESIVETMQEPEDPFIFNMEILDDRAFEGATVEQLRAALPEDYPHSFLAVVDKTATSGPDHALLILDLFEAGGEFRALPSQVASIENNLSIGNMGFEEFAACVDDSGVFRGFPGM